MAVHDVDELRSRLATFNPFACAPGELYPILAQARERHPVFFSEPLDAWCVTRYRDIRTIVMAPRAFSSSNAFPRPQGLPPAADAVAAFVFDNLPVTLLDPPEHAAVRRIANEGFRPRTMAAFEPALREIVAEHTDRLVGRERFDLVHDFAEPVALAAVMALLGFPPERSADFRRWLGDQIAVITGHAFLDRDTLEAHGASFADAVAYMMGVVQERRADPRDDVISYMATCSVDGGPLTDAQVANQALVLLSAGWETTSNAIVNTVLALLRAGAWADLVSGAVAVDDAAAEGLRFDTSALGLFRVALEDVEIGGEQIRAGDMLLLMFSSANHDASEFDRAEEFLLDRGRANRHLSFGHGIHNCVGAPLAKLELAVSLEVLADRFPQLRLSGSDAVEYKALSQFHGPAALWLTG